MRVGMIHQPHFLPWPGYVARCLAADTIVFLDNVKLNKNHFQHRTKYITRTGVEAWLTLPIAHHTRSKPISEVDIADSFSFMRWQRPFREAYQKDVDFHPIWADVSGLIRQNIPSLSAVTVATLVYLLETMTAVSGGKVPLLMRGSSIETASERTQRLAEICADQQLTHLIMGRDAVACHDCDLLRASGLVLVQHVYRGPEARAPRPGVTVLHDVFRLGRAEVVQRLTNDWSLEPITGAGGAT
ncbi:MAG: WbqC family protein [Actinomycetota bacterium]